MPDPRLEDLLFAKPDPPDLRLEFSGRSQKGARYPTCEDSLIVFGGHGRDGRERALHGEARLREEDLIVAVSDGMGGRAAGEIASRSVVETLAEILPRAFRTAALGFEPDIGGLLEEAIAETNRRLFQLGLDDPAHEGLGATLSLGWFTLGRMFLAHVGDSRIYRLRGDALDQLTQDHSRAGIQLLKREINERQYRSHPRRNVLTRALGCGQEQVVAQIDARSVEPGDRFLFCTDGVIDGLWDKHLAEELARPDPSATDLSARILARAVANAGIDDTTLMVVSVYG